MEITQRRFILCLLSLLALLHWAQAEESQITKRAAGQEEVVNADSLLSDDLDELEKRRIFRYGRGVFRYGKRAPVFRYGKRGTLFRYGKRDDDEDAMADSYLDEADWPTADKRLFRWGKRDTGYKRLFRWGKRSGEEDDMMAPSIEKRRIFRYGKRDDESPMSEEIKRKVFRFGKRENLLDDSLTEAEKRFAGIDTRAPQDPHVPFRFGDD